MEWNYSITFITVAAEWSVEFGIVPPRAQKCGPTKLPAYEYEGLLFLRKKTKNFIRNL
ncbi:hypothetical protein ACFFYR_29990 [Paraburkholderia dipogonis]|uniref:hypothetical protein n=1 Tax=Paraburkholderia dipogonis TaxID=1211383 RepID=UPI0035E96550